MGIVEKVYCIWCKSDDFYAISSKVYYDCVKQNRFCIFL